ncbi:MAG: ECF-type sigma factor [Gemmataceae bacterium]
MAQEPTFAEFLARLRQGDDEAARLLFERFGRSLFLRAQARLDQRLRGKIDADDVVNSALKSLCLKIREGRFEVKDWGSLEALLVTITMRKCGYWREYFLARKRDVGRECPMEEDPRGARAAPEPPAREPDPAEVLSLEETVSEMVRELTVEQQQWVRLMLEGFTIHEISERCSVTYEQVWRLVRLVKQRLRRMLDLPDGGKAGLAPA